MLRLRRSIFRNSRFALLLLLVFMVAAGVILFHGVLLPFALAIFLAYLFSPVIDWMNALYIRTWRFPRGLSILVVYALMIGLLVLSGTYLFPRFYFEVNRLVKTLPSVLHNVEEQFIVPFENSLNNWFAEFLPPPPVEEVGVQIDGAAPTHPPGTVTEVANRAPSPAVSPWQVLVDDYTYVVRRLDDSRFEVVPQKRESSENGANRQPFQFNRQVTGAFGQFREGLERNIIEFVLLGREFVQVLVQSFFTLFLVLMLSGFILLDPERIRVFIRSLVPTRYENAFDDWLRRLDHGLSGVVRGQATICLVNGVLTGIGVAVLGVPFVVTLSVIAAVFSLIPIFGVLISSIPILLMALTVSFTTTLLALVWILIIHFIEGNFLNPKILGDSAKIHPVLIVFALLVGQHFAGVLGALLAVPIFSLVQNSFLFLKHKAESLETAL